MRDNLNIGFQEPPAPSYGILTEPGYEDLNELYREEARKLVEQGDFERAVFIYAELLNDITSAVELFERNGRFETAAKLAQGRRLGPTVFVPLWYKAGKKELALKLAVQHSAFEALSNQVDKSDPFYKELIKEWAKRLIEAGDLRKALDLTESIEEMQSIREELILNALHQYPQDPKLVARALKCLSNKYFDRLQALLQAFLDEKERGFVLKRIELAEYLSKKDFEKISTVEDYYTHRLPIWGYTLLRRLLSDEAKFGANDRRRKVALTLSEDSGQLALRVDLRRLNRTEGPKEDSYSQRIILENKSNRVPIKDAVLVSDNRLLIAYEGGKLVLMNHKGKNLWSDTVYKIRGMVPIGNGSRLIIVRDELEGCALSLLDLSSGAHKNIGYFNIEAFHHRADEFGWVVFADRKVFMLDMTSILNAAEKGVAELEHHWSVPVSEPGRLCCVNDEGHDVTFLYQREQGDLLELWSLNKSTLQVECSFIHQNAMPLDPGRTIGWIGQATFCSYSKEKSRMEKHWLEKTSYTYDNEKKLLKGKEGSLATDQEIVSLGQKAKSLLWSSALRSQGTASSVPASGAGLKDDVLEWYGCFGNNLTDVFVVEFTGASAVHSHINAATDHVLVFDNLGRVIVVDLKVGKVIYQKC